MSSTARLLCLSGKPTKYNENVFNHRCPRGQTSSLFCRSIWQSVYLSVCPSIYLSLFLSIYLSISLSVCLAFFSLFFASFACCCSRFFFIFPFVFPPHPVKVDSLEHISICHLPLKIDQHFDGLNVKRLLESADSHGPDNACGVI